ncbi:MAG: tetratricopeptide repeat protein [Cyanobacteria bacterium Co-bin8]|nr:tetratricopeptide repeat protein [Cyanobacteria bacterium Co-bin8]
MFDLVITALEERNFSKAGRLLQAWKQEKPRDPWLKLALARYWEATGDLQRAEPAYLQLLQKVTNAKLMTQARQGIQRVQNEQSRQREHLLEQARTQPGAEAAALLVLEPVHGLAREAAIQGLSQVMKVDVYTARLLLPGQYWRLYRVGNAGELQYFCQELVSRQAPAFWAPVQPIQTLQVFRVQYVQALQPQVQLVCQNDAGQLGNIAFDWAEVSQWVVGQVPIMESVVDLGPWGKLKRKEVTQDFAEVVDLHLLQRGCVLRLCDRTYNYRQSIALGEIANPDRPAPPIARFAWDSLKQILAQHIIGPCWSDFTGFGKSALEYLNLLPSLPTHLDLSRKAPSPWDGAFHLYSGLCFLRASAQTK